MDYRVWGATLEAYQELYLKPKSITKLKQCFFAGDLGQPATEPINKAVKSSMLRLKRCAKAGSEQFKRTKGLSNIR